MADVRDAGPRNPFENATRFLESVQNIVERFQIISLSRQLEVCRGLLVKNQPIDIAVLGQFKAGKSSFLNSLIGSPLLPVGVIPVTTAITRLQGGDFEKVVLRQFDGSALEIPLADVSKYTAEAHNPGNEKNIESVDIFTPALNQFLGIRLVDTPGLGSIFKYHRAISEYWIPEAGTAILAISADRPLSEGDLELIHNMISHTPRIMVLLTKADLISPEQREEVIVFFRNTLMKEFNREFPILLYSTKSDTETFREHFAGLLTKISSNRDSEFRDILKHKTRSLVNNCRSYLELALHAAMESDQERAALMDRILDEKINLEVMRDELNIISREAQRQTRQLIMKYLEQLRGPLTVKTLSDLERDMAGWQGNLWRLTRRYEDWLEEKMDEEMRRISGSEHQHFYGTLKKAHASFSRSLETFRMLLNENVKKVLGLELSGAQWEITVSEPAQPDIKTLQTFDLHFDLIWFLIPMFIFRGIFEKDFLKKVPREVEANLSRLASQWETRINQAISEMKKQALQYVENELLTIEALLSKAHGRTDEIKERIQELQNSS